MRPCILTEDEETLSTLRARDDKKRKKSQKKQPGKKQKTVAAPQDSSDEEDLDVPGVVALQLDDSSEYSDEEDEEDFDAPYPFAQKEAAEGDFVLVELEFEEGREAGTKVHYVGKILNLEENGQYSISFLRLSSKFGCKDSFYFPNNEDVDTVPREKVQGVLVPITAKTARLARIVRFQPPLRQYNLK